MVVNNRFSKVALNEVVDFEYQSMELQLAMDTLASLVKKIENKSGKYSEEEVKAFEAKSATVKADIEAIKATIETLKPNYDEAMAAICADVDDHKGNDYDSVRRLARVLATASNTKLEKYALRDIKWDGLLYDALKACHNVKGATNNGKIKQSKLVVNSYKNAEALCEKILKASFSVPFETDYTNKCWIKFNNTDMAMLHESFTTGFKASYDVDEKNQTITFTGLTQNYLVGAKEDKSGNVNYNWDKFNSLVVRLVMAQIAQ